MQNVLEVTEQDNPYGGTTATVKFSDQTEISINVADEAGKEKMQLLLSAYGMSYDMANKCGAHTLQGDSIQEHMNWEEYGDEDEEEPRVLTDAETLAMTSEAYDQVYDAVEKVAKDAGMSMKAAAAQISAGGSSDREALAEQGAPRRGELGETPQMMQGGGFVAANWTPGHISELHPDWDQPTVMECYNEVQYMIRTQAPQLVSKMFESVVDEWARANPDRILIAEDTPEPEM